MIKFTKTPIKILRELHGMTFDKFAEKIGKPGKRQLVHQWESGKQKPQIDNLCAIANAFGVKITLFFEE